MKALVIHPGHSISTSDVYDGVCAGLRANGVTVEPFDWQRILRTFTGLVLSAAAGGHVPPDKLEALHQFCAHIACADVTNMAITSEVDLVIVVNGLLFPPSRVAPLRRIGLPVVCIGTESPYFDDAEQQIAPYYSHWFTNERTAVDRFRRHGATASYLPMAWNPEVHTPADPDPGKAVDMVFVGGGFPERRAVLGGVDWTGISRAVLGTLWTLDLEAEQGAVDFLRGARWSEGAILNSETRLWHRSAAVALNLHRRMTYVERNTPLPAGSAESLGPRAYEIPAVGGFMLIDDERPEARDVFGDSLATFRAWDSADLERHLRYWLAHPDERERTARAQYEAVQSHSWAHRARALLEAVC